MNFRILALASCFMAACEQPSSSLVSQQQSPAVVASDRSSGQVGLESNTAAAESDAGLAVGSGAVDRAADAFSQDGVKRSEAVVIVAEPPNEEQNRDRVLKSLFAKEMSDEDNERLVNYLDAQKEGADRGREAEKMERATVRAVALLEESLSRVKDGQDPRAYPRVLVYLATDLQFRIERTVEELSKQLAGPHSDEYREALSKMRKLDEALARAEGATADTLARLKKEAQDRIGGLEDTRELLDRSITALREKHRRIGQSLRLWQDASTIDPTTVQACEILRDDFVSLFLPVGR